MFWRSTEALSGWKMQFFGIFMRFCTSELQAAEALRGRRYAKRFAFSSCISPYFALFFPFFFTTYGWWIQSYFRNCRSTYPLLQNICTRFQWQNCMYYCQSCPNVECLLIQPGATKALFKCIMYILSHSQCSRSLWYAADFFTQKTRKRIISWSTLPQKIIPLRNVQIRRYSHQKKAQRKQSKVSNFFSSPGRVEGLRDKRVQKTWCCKMKKCAVFWSFSAMKRV